MSTRLVRTREDEEKMHLRFSQLVAQVKPVPHDVACIQILKRLKRASEFHRLMVKNEGNKHEKAYRNKRFAAQKDCILHLEGYVKSLTP